jgi:hypothetical protein
MASITGGSFSLTGSRSGSPEANLDDYCRRTRTDFNEYTRKRHQHITGRALQQPTPELPAKHVKVVNFDLQKRREPFVKPTDPPHDGRFAITGDKPHILTTEKRPKTVDLKSYTARKPIFRDKHSLPYYNINSEATRRRGTSLIPDFKKIPDRPENILHH